MDRKKRSRQASFSNDESDAFYQSSFDIAFFIGDDHFDYSVDKKIEKRVK